MKTGFNETQISTSPLANSSPSKAHDVVNNQLSIIKGNDREGLFLRHAQPLRLSASRSYTSHENFGSSDAHRKIEHGLPDRDNFTDTRQTLGR